MVVTWTRGVELVKYVYYCFALAMRCVDSVAIPLCCSERVSEAYTAFSFVNLPCLTARTKCLRQSYYLGLGEQRKVQSKR